MRAGPEYLSPTQLLMYFRCGEQYRRRYLEGEKLPPGIAAISGKAVHKGAETNYSQKLASKQDLPVNAIEMATADSFDTFFRESGVQLTREQENRGLAIILGQAKDSAVAMASVYHETLARKVQPEFVEQKVIIPAGGGIPKPLLGIIDIASENGDVIDIKTGSKKKTQSEADRDLQLTWYSVAYRWLTKKRPRSVQFHTVSSARHKVSAEIIHSTRDETDETILSNYLKSALHGIDSGFFPPANPQSFWCSERYCGYARTCRFYNINNKQGSTER